MNKILSNINIYDRRHIVPLLLLFLLSGCMKDDGPGDGQGSDSEPVSIMFSPFAGTSSLADPSDPSTDPDEVVEEFRVMAFDSSDGMLVFNELYDFKNTLENPVEVKVLPGTYDFVFIANEHSDPATHALLGAMDDTATLSQLAGYSFAHTAFSADLPIPMAKVCYGVVLDASQGVSTDGGTTYFPASETAPWKLAIERLGVRVDMTLTTTYQQIAQDFKGHTFGQIPGKVYILPARKDGTAIYNNTGVAADFRTDITYGLSDGDAGYTSGMVYNSAEGVYEWKKSRMIFPESVFADKTDKSLGMQLAAKFTSYPEQTAVLGPVDNCGDGSDHGYILPRNHHVVMKGDLDMNLNMELRAVEWSIAIDEDYDPGKVYSLNVSETSFRLRTLSGYYTIEVTTDYPDGWTADISSSQYEIIDVSGNSRYNWLKLQNTSGMQGKGELVFYTVNASYLVRTYIHITAGNMTAVVEVWYDPGAS